MLGLDVVEFVEKSKTRNLKLNCRSRRRRRYQMNISLTRQPKTLYLCHFPFE